MTDCAGPMHGRASKAVALEPHRPIGSAAASSEALSRAHEYSIIVRLEKCCERLRLIALLSYVSLSVLRVCIARTTKQPGPHVRSSRAAACAAHSAFYIFSNLIPPFEFQHQQETSAFSKFSPTKSPSSAGADPVLTTAELAFSFYHKT